ncbi:MAG TPA: branched-chain amino acid ABC transporter permease [Hyphomicrobiaceae bacterium]|jgi:branched-chain amino acid transport system permease protein|nr:branched-chain amino acid ABC transporter permease [Hyphomicrobiaceae bacterium]
MIARALPRSMKYAGVVAALLGLALLPLWVSNPYFLSVLTLAALYAIFASSWDILSGYIGQFNFGHAAFFGAGAYATGFLAPHIPVALVFAAGALAAAAFALLMGLPCLKLRGPYLSLTTLVFPLILERLAFTFRDITGGEYGLTIASPLSRIGLYYASLVLLAATLAVLLAVADSRIGRTFRAIGDDDQAAMAAGINTTRYKLGAFVLGATLAGLGGVLYSYHLRHVGPEMFGLFTSFQIVIMGVVGGTGTILGPAIGAYFLTLLGESLREIETFRILIYSGVLILCVMLFPRGLWGLGAIVGKLVSRAPSPGAAR